MKTLRIDIAAGMPAEVLTRLAQSGRVDVHSIDEERQVGTCAKYWVTGDELWAELELADDARIRYGVGMHAESMCAGDPPELLCIVLTSLPRGALGAILQTLGRNRAERAS